MNLIELHDVKGTPATFRAEAIECVYSNPEKPETGIVQTTSKLLYQVQESYDELVKLLRGQSTLVETLNQVHGTKKPRRKKNDEVPQQED